MAAPRHRLLVLAAGLLVAALAVPVAQAAVSADAAAKQIGERYQVEVLMVRPGEVGKRKVWLITVMQPAGNSNGAFRVHVLAVDQQSGDLVSSFRPYTDDYSLPPAAPGSEARSRD